MQYSAIQCSTIQYNTIQYSRVHCSNSGTYLTTNSRGERKFNLKLCEDTGKILKNTCNPHNFKPFKDNNENYLHLFY